VSRRRTKPVDNITTTIFHQAPTVREGKIPSDILY